ncbi:cytochrome b [Rhodomicrobium lacus]|uniref:cytochrome b n=1 Tax=Rhodomicrobium lacus TaxID=2498452 RepID=UPI000F8D3463|nr:cytochrome b [Rhodomicrobium lacus]
MNFRYGPWARTFHWTIALLVFFMLALGAYMTKGIGPDDPIRGQLYSLHKATGALILFLVLIRLLVRFNNAPPVLDDQPALIRVGSRLNHYALYLMLIAQPLIGIFLSQAADRPVSFYGLFTLPKLIAPQPKPVVENLAAAHQIGAGILVLLIGLHIAGALYHWLIKQDGVMRRMAWW